MVVFTCNACGQSIRKSRVEKHWQTECRNCEVLSCMDCGKDFYGEEYAEHTSCISEAEKYQGALFKGEKGGGTKGEKKQQQWIQNIRGMLSTREFSPRIANLLGKILEYPNIPRKKAKFQNFLKNSINVRDMRTLDTLWDIFTEASMQKTNDSPENVKADDGVTTADDINKPNQANGKENGTVEQETIKSNSVESDPIKKKKKKKREVVDEQVENNTSEMDSADGSKKKKKKRKDVNEEVTIVKRKRNRDDVELDNCDVVQTSKKSKTLVSDDISIKKSKKHKSKVS